MSRNGGFDDNDQLPPGLYSQLLFGDDEISDYLEFTTTNSDALDTCNKSKSNGASTGDESNSDVTTQKMLCFGDYAKQEGDETACMGSNGVKLSSLPDSRRKRNGLTLERNAKRSKADSSSVTGHAKVANKKQKLGDRITALQQLVSPFGKTDTASVLHEALGYIRFLQDQVQVLCSPYLQRQSHSPSSMPCPNHENGGGFDKNENKGKRSDDLKSRGLCLVPVELTLHVADSNGADLWSTASHGQPSIF